MRYHLPLEHQNSDNDVNDDGDGKQEGNDNGDNGNDDNVIESGFDEDQQNDIFNWIGNLKMNASQISTLWGFED